ncbi:MAG: hypothetical protein N2235_23090 [Fischerella sp.]|nr:hypothetical protein [Fischerella sp.]
MSTTLHQYFAVERLNREAEGLGFVVRQNYNLLALFPKDDNLPLLARDQAVATAETVEELAAFLWGWERSRDYLKMLRLVNDQKIQRREQDYRNSRLAALLENGISDIDKVE